MKYVLAVLSHGYPHSPTLRDTIVSYTEQVHPPPEWVEHHHDGPLLAAPFGASVSTVNTDTQEGFAVATRRLWWAAAQAAKDRGCDYVFWLEHDFVFRRPVSIEAMAHVLRDCSIAQVALMRDPVNDTERKAGGVVQSRPGQFEQADGFLTHRAYFTTNPSLMRATFMRENPWPQYDTDAEGLFGIALRERGYRFAVMGNGEPWVKHIGERNGKGY